MPTEDERDSSTASVVTDIDADPTVVWDAITTDEGFARWMGDGAQIEVGDDQHVFAPDPVTGRPKRGAITHVDEGRRVDFTWWPIDEPADRSDVSILVEPSVIGTRITVTERSAVVATARAAVANRIGAAWNWRCSMLSLACSLVRC